MNSAGKSSLGVALFRLYPTSEGLISVDEVETAMVGLHELRYYASLDFLSCCYLL